MKNITIFDATDPKVFLSSLWAFILFSIFFADFQWLITSEALDEISSGVVRGNTVSEDLLIFASIVHTIPILMFLSSRITKRSINRWLNISIGLLFLLITISDGWTTPDQIFFKITETIALVLIVRIAWTWKKDF